MKEYFKSCLAEIPLLSAASACLLLNFAKGFYIPNAVAHSVPLALGISLGLTLLMAVGSYNLRSSAILSAALLLAMAGLFLFLRTRHIDIVDAEGSETSVYIYYFAALVIPLAAFFLSRTAVGCGILAVLGILLGGLIDYLDYGVNVAAAVLFPVCVSALYILRSFRKEAKRSAAVSPAFGRLGLTAFLTSAAAALLGTGVFFLLVRPLNPPVMQVELVARYLDYAVFEVTGVARNYPIPDELLRTDNEPLSEVNSEETNDSTSADQTQEQELPPLPANEELPSSWESGSSPSETEELSSVSYGPDLTTIFTVLLLAVVFLLAFGIATVTALHRRRIEKLLALPPCEQVITLYCYFLDRFSAIGFHRPASQTAEEYMALHGEALSPYTAGTLSLKGMTEAFTAARYGGIAPDADVSGQFRGFYAVFLKNYRRMHGTGKYLLHRFAIRKSRRI